MGEKPLFDALPEHKAPERPRGKPRVQEPERDSIELRVVALDSLVASDDPVRDVWAYVETLDLTSLYTRIEAREGEPGRPPITPKLLMASPTLPMCGRPEAPSPLSTRTRDRSLPSFFSRSAVS